MAYGLYDQAAELVQKALDAAPNRRDLKLKLLEVFFVWGNKDAFLSAAQNLRKEIGQKPDADWDKVVIMRRGKPAVIADRDPPKSLVAYAAAEGALPRIIGRDFDFRRAPGGWRRAEGRGSNEGRVLPLPYDAREVERT